MAVFDHEARLRRVWRSRAGLYSSIAFVALAALSALLLWTSGGGGDGATPLAPPGESPPPTVTTTDHDLSIPVIAPETNWVVFNGVSVPDGATKYGPLRSNGSAVAGFADTPRGALFAMANATVRRMLAGDDWKTVVNWEIAPGAGTTQWLKERAQIQGPVSIPDPMQFAGFKFVFWTPQTAVIDWASRAADGTLQMTTGTAVWQGGDWRLQLQADASDTATQEPMSSLDGFVQWGASA